MMEPAVSQSPAVLVSRERKVRSAGVMGRMGDPSLSRWSGRSSRKRGRDGRVHPRVCGVGLRRRRSVGNSVGVQERELGGEGDLFFGAATVFFWVGRVLLAPSIYWAV